MVRIMINAAIWTLLCCCLVFAESSSSFPKWGEAEVVAVVKIPGNFVNSATAADLNNDGLQDYLLTLTDDVHPFPIVVLVNNGRGAFEDVTKKIFVNAPPKVIRSGQNPVVADFNGDGRPDVYLADFGNHTPTGGAPGYHNSLILSTGKSKLKNATATLPKVRIGTGHGAATGDIDNDGDLDIYVVQICCGEEIPHLLINDGNGKFSASFDRLPIVTGNMISSEFIDMDLDGFVDLFLGGAHDAQNYLLLNDGNGFFSIAGSLPNKRPAAGETLQISSCNLNNDAFPDLLIGSTIYETGESQFQALINKKDGTFKDVTNSKLKKVKTGSSKFFLVDIDADGDPDILGRDFANEFHGISLNTGKGRFRTKNFAFDPNVIPGFHQSNYALIDIDGDGGRDLFSPQFGPIQGKMTFAVARSLGPPTRPALPSRISATKTLRGKVMVSWNYAWGAVSYEIWRSDISGGPPEFVGEAKKTFFQDSSVTTDRVYFYYVRSKNSAGLSDFSSEAPGSAK